MGKGGRVVLMNGTKNAWIKRNSHTYQMNHWEFPARVEPGSCAVCYIEWNEHAFKNVKDDKGECWFELEGVGGSFMVGAQAEHGFDLFVKYDNLSNLGSNQLHLGFNHNGYMPFVIAGRPGKFVSSSTNNGASSWMSDNLDLIGNCNLRDLCLPGSHNSGMSQIHSPTAFVNRKNTQTQAVEIRDQLMRGIRYFDIRPVIGGGVFHTGHYSKVGSGWQGARGQVMDTIVQQINEFTSHSRELIVISLSHSLNTDLGNSHYRPLNQPEYERLFNQLKNIKDLFVTSNETVNLLDRPVNYFLGAGKSAVVIVMNDRANLGSFHYQGFFLSSEFAVVDDYADSHDLNKMIDDQMRKLAKNRGEGKNFFLLSWILTLQGIDNIDGLSIEFLAHQANTNVHRLILDLNFSSLIRRGYPNVISQDFVSSDSTSLALAVNLFRAHALWVAFDEKQFKSINSSPAKFDPESYSGGVFCAFLFYLLMVVFVLGLIFLNGFLF